MKRIGYEKPRHAVSIAQAAFPSPFPSELEYSSPARGTWNIVHTGMLIPGAHEIFVCAQGCLRGVVLTAAEMNASSRFSTISIRENNVLDGDMEDLIIDGVSNILDKLPDKPPAVLVYTSCIHHFMGCDLPMVYRVLGEKYPDIQFTDCYMTPILRKSGLTPDQIMRRQLYSLLKPCGLNPKAVNLAGNDFSYDPDSELCTLLKENGYIIHEVTSCKTYEDYQKIAESSWCITTFPAAREAGRFLEERFGQKHLHLPLSFDYEEIIQNLYVLSETLHVKLPDYTEKIAQCEKRLEEIASIIGKTPVAIDYTAFSRPLSLARLLLKHGFQVTRIYADGFTGEEKQDFELLQKDFPNLAVYPTIQPGMRVASRQNSEKFLAVGQKAAYFTGTNYFVNIVESGGFYGFQGILRLADAMQEAFEIPKDTRSLIQIKGMGCECCL